MVQVRSQNNLLQSGAKFSGIFICYHQNLSTNSEYKNSSENNNKDQFIWMTDTLFEHKKEVCIYKTYSIFLRITILNIILVTNNFEHMEWL